MVAAPYEMFNMGNKTHPQQPDIGNYYLYTLKVFKRLWPKKAFKNQIYFIETIKSNNFS